MDSTMIGTLVFVGIFMISIAIYVYIAIYRSKIRSAHDQGKLIFLYNSKERKIRLDNSPLNRAINKFIYQDTYKNVDGDYKWNKLSALSEKFAGTDGASAIRSLINSLNTDQRIETVDFKVSNFGWATNKTFSFTITGVKLEREDMFSLVVKWEPIIDISYKEAASAETPFAEIANITHKHYGFVAFNTNIKVKNSTFKFINAYIKLSKKKSLVYFMKRNIVVLVVTGRRPSQVHKSVKRIKNLVRTKGLEVSLNHYYNATGVVEVKNVTSVQKIAKIFSLIEYLIYLSLSHNKAFVTTKSKQYNLSESLEFIEASHEFRSSLKTGNFKEDTLSVKKRSNNRHVVNYVRPLVNGVSGKMANKILTNKTNGTYLIDSFAEVMSRKSKSSPILVDVNDYWLIKFGGTFTNKRAIYIVNVNSWTDSLMLVSIVRNLKEQGFYFALRIRKFNEEISGLIQNIEPQFIVIDELLAQNPYDSDAYISILSINKFAEEDDIKVIFENPVDYYDQIREDQIGLVYYYSFE